MVFTLTNYIPMQYAHTHIHTTHTHTHNTNHKPVLILIFVQNKINGNHNQYLQMTSTFTLCANQIPLFFQLHNNVHVLRLSRAAKFIVYIAFYCIFYKS